VAVAPPPLPARTVGLDDPPVHVGRVLGYPLEECGAEIEADPGVVVQQVADPALGIEQPRADIGRVAFARDPLVPVVERRGGVLALNDVEPGILAWRLIKMSVDANVARVGHAWDGSSAARRARHGPGDSTG